MTLWHRIHGKIEHLKPFTEVGIKQNTAINVYAPSSAYNIQIKEVYLVEEECWVISQITKSSEEMATAMVTKCTDSVQIENKKRPIVHKVLGKDWNWGEDTEGVHFPKDQENLMKKIREKNGIKIYAA